MKIFTALVSKIVLLHADDDDDAALMAAALMTKYPTFAVSCTGFDTEDADSELFVTDEDGVIH